MYDVIIVGAGPAGIMTAYELIQNNKNKKVLLIEQGHSIKKRFCPREKLGKCINCKPYCNITSGYSGAGAFSDGKLNSYHLSKTGTDDIYLGGNDGGFFRKYYSNEEIKEVIKYTDEVYVKFGACKELEGLKYPKEVETLQNKAKENNLSLVTFPIRHIGTEKTHELFNNIEDYLLDNIEIMFDTNVKDLIIENGKCIGVKIVSAFKLEETPKEILGNHIVLSVGRKGANWLCNVCKSHDIKTTSGAIDIGIRYELPDKVMKDVNKYLYEAKFIGRVGPFKDKVRTFCQNPSGFVATEVYDNNLVLANGHSYKERKSTNTNLAILASHNFTKPFDDSLEYGRNIGYNMNMIGNGKLICQRFGDLLKGKRSWDSDIANNSVVPTLNDFTAGDISYALGYRTLTDIIEIIKAIDKVIPGFANEDNLMYGPEIKFYSNVVIIDKNFETNIRNLYSIGDGGGLTTGLIMASASGIQMARILTNKAD